MNGMTRWDDNCAFNSLHRSVLVIPFLFVPLLCMPNFHCVHVFVVIHRFQKSSTSNIVFSTTTTIRTCRKNKKCFIFHELSKYVFFRVDWSFKTSLPKNNVFLFRTSPNFCISIFGNGKDMTKTRYLDGKIFKIFYAEFVVLFLYWSTMWMS